MTRGDEQAYPSGAAILRKDGSVEFMPGVSHGGMTIREKLAAMNHAAMIQAYYSSPEAADRIREHASDSGIMVETWMAAIARCDADALLAELARGGE